MMKPLRLLHIPTAAYWVYTDRAEGDWIQLLDDGEIEVSYGTLIGEYKNEADLLATIMETWGNKVIVRDPDNLFMFSRNPAEPHIEAKHEHFEFIWETQQEVEDVDS